MRLTIRIVRAVVATGSVILYFKKRKLYVDDKYYKLRILPKKTIRIYRKDLFNIIGIIGSMTVCVSIGEKVYLFVKEHDFTFTISEKNLPLTDKADVDVFSVPESVDIVSSPDPIEGLSLSETEKKILKSKKKLPIRDIMWLGIAIGITYYLSQRIDNLPVSPNDKPFNGKPDLPVRTTTQLSWRERRGLPDWMIRDISNEGTYGQITRPTIPDDIVEPIANPHPRRIVVVLFGVLQKMPTPNKDTKIIPNWVYSPLFAGLQALYNRFNK